MLLTVLPAPVRPFSRLTLAAMFAVAVLVQSSPVYGLDIPQVPSNPTPEELTKLTAQYEALSKLLTAQLSLINAQGQIAAANDPVKQQQAIDAAAATNATNLANIQKALVQAQSEKAAADLAVLKAQYQVGVTAPFSGNATVPEKGGDAEATLLAALAVKTIGAEMAKEIKSVVQKQAIDRIVVTTQTPDFQALLSYEAQFAGMTATHDAVIADTADAAKKAGIQEASLAAATLGLDAIKTIFGFFKTDYEFKVVTVPAKENQLMAAVAGSIQEPNLKIYMPERYQPQVFKYTNSPSDQIQQPYVWRKQAATSIEKYGSLITKLDADLDKEKKKLAKAVEDKDEVKKTAAEKVIDDLNATLQLFSSAKKLWEGFAVGIDNWMARMSTADDKGSVAMVQVVRQMALRDLYGITGPSAKKTAIVVVSLDSAIGNAYVKKNMWSSLGANPFYVMGGAVATLTVLDGTEGRLLAASSFPYHGGYASVSEVKELVNKQYDNSSSSSSVPQADKHSH